MFEDNHSFSNTFSQQKKREHFELIYEANISLMPNPDKHLIRKLTGGPSLSQTSVSVSSTKYYPIKPSNIWKGKCHCEQTGLIKGKQS